MRAQNSQFAFLTNGDSTRKTFLLSWLVVHVIFLLSIAETPEDFRKVCCDDFDPFFRFMPVGCVEDFVDSRVERLLFTQSFSYADNPPRVARVFTSPEGIPSQVGNEPDLIPLPQDGDMHTLPLRLRLTRNREGLARGEMSIAVDRIQWGR